MAELTIVDLPFEYEQNISNTPVDPGFVSAGAGGDTFRSTGREVLLVLCFSVLDVETSHARPPRADVTKKRGEKPTASHPDLQEPVPPGTRSS